MIHTFSLFFYNATINEFSQSHPIHLFIHFLVRSSDDVTCFFLFISSVKETSIIYFFHQPITHYFSFLQDMHFLQEKWLHSFSLCFISEWYMYFFFLSSANKTYILFSTGHCFKPIVRVLVFQFIFLLSFSVNDTFISCIAFYFHRPIIHEFHAYTFSYFSLSDSDRWNFLYSFANDTHAL